MRCSSARTSTSTAEPDVRSPHCRAGSRFVTACFRSGYRTLLLAKHGSARERRSSMHGRFVRRSRPPTRLAPPADSVNSAAHRVAFFCAPNSSMSAFPRCEKRHRPRRRHLLKSAVCQREVNVGGTSPEFFSDNLSTCHHTNPRRANATSIEYQENRRLKGGASPRLSADTACVDRQRQMFSLDSGSPFR